MIRLIALFMMASFPNPAAAAPLRPSFSKAVVPVLKAQCMSCHMTGAEAGGLALSPAAAYRSLVNVAAKKSAFKLVQPGAPDKSYLLMKVEGTHLDHGGRGARMPFGGAPLDNGAIALIRSWIASGAPNN
ncbi:hypothetical protein [Sphingomonas sp. SRS2]|uniref:hypothetical protein n=1 Tax=Sphingomonas sp. SRS2 TaxID=133190 RepID=UPI0006184C26|nr:hypothetical protein [Sphingomonas sp. SRS2]KKC26032.1 hypothetical protein WP12_10435 [Sphingomonas sp. SRS2]